jgi:replicative DNA helicase
MGATLAQMEQALQTVRTEAPARELTPLRKYIETYWDPEPEPVEGRAGSIRTHLDGLDGLLGTLTSTAFVIVAARTGVGKTNLMLNLARNASVSQGARVAFFSLEMPAEQLVQRLIASVSRVDSKRLRQRDHSEQEERRVMDALGLLAEAPVYIDDSSALRLPELRTKCLQMQRKVGLDLVVVDYLQLILAESRNGNRVQEVSDITRTLKRLAGELQVPIVAGSQLSRAPEQRADHRPHLSDLRESGSIEQDADVVVFIHREEAYWSEEAWIAQHPDAVRDPYPRGLADLIVAKNRHGPTGTVTTRFHAGWALFEAIDDVVERQAALV